MNNTQIAQALRNMSAALQIQDANRFRIIAYEKAADSIEHLTSDVKDIWEEGKLDTIPGVGPTIAQHLDELMKTGKVKHFEATFKGLSPALFILLQVPGVGPKRAYQLTKEFNLHNPKTVVEDLATIDKEGRIAKMEGWGDKSQADILSAIETYKKGQIKENRMALPFADQLAEEMITYLTSLKLTQRIDRLGSLRRKVATIGDIDLAAATTKPLELVSAFVKYPKVRKIIDQGPKGATVLLSVGKQVDLRVQKPGAYGAMLQYFTGSKHHNIKLREFALKKGLSLNEHGIKNLKTGKTTQYKTEADFYSAVGLSWIPPEIREDGGEIEASQNHKLPRLVEAKDIRGEVHVHSNYDLLPSHDLGTSSLEMLLNQAALLNYDYLGISDHNPKQVLSEYKIIDILKRRKEKFEHIYDSWSKRVKPFDKASTCVKTSADKRVHLLIMLEVDITPSGKLALPERAFDYVDGVIVSLHSSFNLPKEQMTKRVLEALSHPKAKIWGHPTARLLGQREGVDVDWEVVFDYCTKNNKALEINSWPQRLDLPDRMVREAIKQGVKLVINTDSHAKDQMSGITYGVDVARRGWAEKKDILNTMEYNEFSKWLKS